MVANIVKNGKVHTEGDTNVRACKCKHCNEKILKGEGYKIIGYGNFGFVHNHCRPLYSPTVEQKTFQHGIVWEVSVTARKGIVESLGMLGWTALDSKATLTMTSLNKFKALKGLGQMLVEVTILDTRNGNEKTFTTPYTTYDHLRTRVIIETKRTRKGDNGDYSSYPDFENIY